MLARIRDRIALRDLAYLRCRIIDDKRQSRVRRNLGGKMIKWISVYRKLQALLDTPGDSYFSGPRFIRVMQDFNPELPDYY